MTDIAYPLTPVLSGGFVQGRGRLLFAGLSGSNSAASLRRDFRYLGENTGVISDQVVLKAGGIETPFANAKVQITRLSDGFKAWEGRSDAGGNYTATGLELGVAYIPVATDSSGSYKAVAAGPVIAVAAS